MSEKRSSFTGKIGFVLAAAGSAVGLGNIWRFPYLAAKYGGGIFLLTYIILAVTFGFALMCAEIAIGRKTGQSAINAFKTLNKKYSFIGWIASIIPIIILPYYSVIGGWVMKYISVFIGGSMGKAAGDDYFTDFITGTTEPIGWFLLFIGLTALVVIFGVEKGVEKISKFIMPMLLVMTVFIAIYAMTMDGALAGVKFYLLPDFKKFSFITVLAAMGQLFYSMSIAMGIMITYGSYMKKDINLESSVKQIEIFDTAVAFLAGLMIIPAVFAFSGGNEAALGKGPSLMFVTLPKVFNSMVFFAAITSSISLMETVVSIISDKLGWKRIKTCIAVFIGSVVLGLPSALGWGVLKNIMIGEYTILDMFDFASNSILMPIVAFLTCIFVGYIIKPKSVIEEIEITGRFKNKKLFVVMIKYIAPICIVLILISSLLDALGLMKI